MGARLCRYVPLSGQPQALIPTHEVPISTRSAHQAHVQLGRAETEPGACYECSYFLFSGKREPSNATDGGVARAGLALLLCDTSLFRERALGASGVPLWMFWQVETGLTPCRYSFRRDVTSGQGSTDGQPAGNCKFAARPDRRR